VLAEYRYAPNPAAATARFVNSSTPAVPALNLARDNVPVPFTLKTAVELEDNGGSFNITLTSRLTTREIEHLVAEMHLGEGAGGIKCVTARGGAADRYGRGVEGVGASWAFDSNKKILRWEIPVVSPSSSWSLRGSFTTSVQTPRPSHALQMRFEIQSHTFSALKVDQLKVTGEGYKPYKGVRGRSVGNVEWRW